MLNSIKQDKASSQTSQSTAIFIEKIKKETGIKTVLFKCIPLKRPGMSYMNYWEFGLFNVIF